VLQNGVVQKRWNELIASLLARCLATRAHKQRCQLTSVTVIAVTRAARHGSRGSTTHGANQPVTWTWLQPKLGATLEATQLTSPVVR